jgi:PqqD family protein of HPr-rel-A system
MSADESWTAVADLTIVDLDGGSVVYEPATGSLHHVDPFAAAVLSCCQATITTEVLVADIIAAGSDAAAAPAMAADALGALRAAGLVTTAADG